jgi:RimJ/RimL family protein N-acetyltransferase
MVTYIVSTYFGKRRSKLYNKFWEVDIYYFVKQHIQKLNELNNPDVQKIIFVVNHYNHMIDQGILPIIQKANSKIPIEVIFRPNKNLSYGAWNEAIIASLEDSSEYFFLIEDDYLPSVDEFYKVFQKEMDSDVCFVGQLVNFAHQKIHPSISNGLLSSPPAKWAYENYKTVFKLSPDTNDSEYLAGTLDQVIYLQYLLEKYQAKDVSNTTCIPFLESTEDPDKFDIVIYYGNKEEKEVIQPAQSVDNLFKFRTVKESDAGFINKIRNTYADTYLHDSRTFTVTETTKWIKDTSPEYFIINYLGVDVGYFRTSNYNSTNNNIYVGCDISSDFTGQGLGYLVYLSFLNFLFKKYDLHKISLEVLSTNARAIHLYHKLGFILEGTKREDVKKKEEYIDSLIYSILKPEFYKEK